MSQTATLQDKMYLPFVHIVLSEMQAAKHCPKCWSLTYRAWQQAKTACWSSCSGAAGWRQHCHAPRKTASQSVCGTPAQSPQSTLESRKGPCSPPGAALSPPLGAQAGFERPEPSHRMYAGPHGTVGDAPNPHSSPQFETPRAQATTAHRSPVSWPTTKQQRANGTAKRCGRACTCTVFASGQRGIGCHTRLLLAGSPA